jgi:hypothetical protein
MRLRCTGGRFLGGFRSGKSGARGRISRRGPTTEPELPGEREWTLIVNKETGQFHLNYNPTQDFGRTKTGVREPAAPVETFRIEVRTTGGDTGALAPIREKTEASVPFTVLLQWLRLWP